MFYHFIPLWIFWWSQHTSWKLLVSICRSIAMLIDLMTETGSFWNCVLRINKLLIHLSVKNQKMAWLQFRFTGNKKGDHVTCDFPDTCCHRQEIHASQASRWYRWSRLDVTLRPSQFLGADSACRKNHGLKVHALYRCYG